jgi:hypothetical protein
VIRVVIKKGGKLLVLRRHQKINGRGRHVTSLAHRFLFDDCEIGAGVKLRDIFLLIRSNIKQLDPILGHWCKESVAEGLSRGPKSDKLEDLEYLELYKTFHAGKKESYGLSRPSFHGVGFKLRKDKTDRHGNMLGKKGERTQWAISLTPAYKLASLPLRLNTTMRVFDNNFRTMRWGHELAEYGGITYTLGEVLLGVLWELTYHGPPEKRDKFGDELRSRAEKVRSGREQPIPAGDALKSLRKWHRRLKK